MAGMPSACPQFGAKVGANLNQVVRAGRVPGAASYAMAVNIGLIG